MSKKKKRNRAPEPIQKPGSGSGAPTLVDEVLQCTDGIALGKEHLARRAEILFFATSATFQSFQMEDVIGEDFEDPTEAVLDYLEFGARALGMTDVAAVVKKNFPAAIVLFDETLRKLDGEAIGRAISNAKAMEFLLA